MKKCEYCDAPIHDEDQFCIQCGRKIKRTRDVTSENTFVYGFFSLILPILGFLMYFLLKDTRSNQAKTSLKWALIGIAGYIVIGVAFILFYFYILVEILT